MLCARNPSGDGLRDQVVDMVRIRSRARNCSVIMMGGSAFATNTSHQFESRSVRFARRLAEASTARCTMTDRTAAPQSCHFKMQACHLILK